MRHIALMFKTASLAVVAGLLMLFIAYQVSAAPLSGDSLLRVEVKTQKGDIVKVSAPTSLLDVLYRVMPKEIKQISTEVQLTPDEILKELKTLDGEDLVRVEGTGEVRVWIDDAIESQRDLGFIKVYFKEAKENGHVVNVCIPRGLVHLAGRVASQLGLVDKFVELPDEIKGLKVVHPKDQNE